MKLPAKVWGVTINWKSIAVIAISWIIILILVFNEWN